MLAMEFIGQLEIFTAFGTNATITPGTDAFNPVFAFTHQSAEPDQYYYHPDHLGSSNYITNADGTVNQHIEYFAFGESFVDEHLNSYNTPYKFNGKELDEETGWYYYGARYYDPRTSLWLSVDPLAHKYPNMSPYNYCANNPVIFLDLDGNGPILPLIIGLAAHKRFATYMKLISGGTNNWKPEYIFKSKLRADLMYVGGKSNKKGIGSIWELKPKSYLVYPTKFLAISQILQYCKTANDEHSEKLKWGLGTFAGNPAPFTGDLYLTVGKYKFHYWISDANLGLITYDYEQIEVEPKPKEVPEDVPVGEPVPEEKPEINPPSPILVPVASKSARVLQLVKAMNGALNIIFLPILLEHEKNNLPEINPNQ